MPACCRATSSRWTAALRRERHPRRPGGARAGIDRPAPPAPALAPAPARSRHRLPAGAADGRARARHLVAGQRVAGARGRTRAHAAAPRARLHDAASPCSASPPTGACACRSTAPSCATTPTPTRWRSTARASAPSAPTGVTLASAIRALANGDGSEVQLFSSAQVVRGRRGPQDVLEFLASSCTPFSPPSGCARTCRCGCAGRRRAARRRHEYDNLAHVVELKGASAPPSCRVRAALHREARRMSTHRKLVFITGASSGIGPALAALRYAKPAGGSRWWRPRGRAAHLGRARGCTPGRRRLRLPTCATSPSMAAAAAPASPPGVPTW